MSGVHRAHFWLGCVIDWLGGNILLRDFPFRECTVLGVTTRKCKDGLLVRFLMDLGLCSFLLF